MFSGGIEMEYWLKMVNTYQAFLEELNTGCFWISNEHLKDPEFW